MVLRGKLFCLTFEETDTHRNQVTCLRHPSGKGPASARAHTRTHTNRQAPSLSTFGYVSLASGGNAVFSTQVFPFLFVHCPHQRAARVPGKGTEAPKFRTYALLLAQDALGQGHQVVDNLQYSVQEFELIETIWGPVKSSDSGQRFHKSLALTDSPHPMENSISVHSSQQGPFHSGVPPHSDSLGIGQ